ncbi:chemotaxis protein CheW [Azospirillum sp.]|uniref:chemotaxis protein CheW n=1 Tax=Azospirillum sp. TaxID=34012 RepID=UPI002D69B63C|nr:chemotaxis protein CheW [Azospirillum sp.]HYD68930.1 chemotaxis protein CheW [Azospirillum sp.]
MTERPQYVTLGVGHEVFALPVEVVQEILDPRPIAHLPQAPAHLLGMIDVRGRGVPVIDLRRKLGLAPAEAGASGDGTRILVLEVPVAGRGLVLGLVADRVFEVTALDEDRLAPPPEIGARWNSACIAGVGRRGGAFVIVFDLERLLAADAVLLPDGAAAGLAA